jgi:hypothetical protein
MTRLDELDCRFLLVAPPAANNSKPKPNSTPGSGMDQRRMWTGCVSGGESRVINFVQTARPLGQTGASPFQGRPTSSRFR